MIKRESPRAENLTRVVIDCDPGRDDALAILAALGSPDVQVDFISTVAGNVPLDRGTENALGILAVAGVDDVPVYSGAAAPLCRPLVPGSTMHGDMADGDPALPDAISSAAGVAHGPLAEWCRERGLDRKHLIAIGPLTNIGRLLADDPDALAGVDEIYVMGGTVSRMSTRVSPTAEFNFHTDPEAAALVLAAEVPIKLYDYDATTSCQLDVEGISQIAAEIGPPVGPFVEGWLWHLWEYANRVYGREGIAVHDLYAALGATGFQPGRWEWHELSVDTSDSRRGTLDSMPATPGTGVAVARDLSPVEMAIGLVEAARRLPANRAR